MRLLFLTWREWQSRPSRAALTVLSVAFAVAAVFGSSLAESLVRRAYSAMSEAAEGPPALEVVAKEGGRFLRSAVPSASDLTDAPQSEGMMVRLTSAFTRGKKWRTLVLGLDQEAPAGWSRLELAEGRLPKEEGEALIDASVAKSLGVVIPGRITILARRGTAAIDVVGAVSSSSLFEFGEGVTLLVTLDTAHKVFGWKGQVDRVRFVAKTPELRDALRKELAERLPAELTVRSPVSRTRLSDEILRSTELALQFAGALAMALAAFMILNTMRMNFGERRRQYAIMRALGATSNQVGSLVLAEGLSFGLLGVFFGLPLGLLLAYGLTAAMQRVLGGPLSIVRPSCETILLGCLVGPIVALLASWFVVRQSRRLSPLEGMQEFLLEAQDDRPRQAAAASLLIWAAAAAGLAAVAMGSLSAGWAIPAGLAMLIGYILLIPAVLRPISQALFRLLPKTLLAEGFIVSRQAKGRTIRMSLTIGVLVAAISNGLGLGHAILNNVNDLRGWYKRSMAGDLFLQPLAAADPSLDVTKDSLLETIRGIEGVGRVETVRFRSATASDEPVSVVLREFDSGAPLPWSQTKSQEAETRQGLSQKGAVVSSVLAKRLGVSAGGSLRLDYQGRVYGIAVAQVVNDYTMGGHVVFLKSAAAQELFDIGPANLYVVTRAQDAPAGLDERLQAVAQENGFLLQSFAELRDRFDRLIEGIVNALFVLMGIGFVVGGMGVSNALTMSVLEQTREIGLLRIAGMTKRQIRRLVLVEGLLIGSVGVLLGMLGGMTTALVIHLCNWALLDRSVAFELNGWLFAANILGCLLVTLLAAWTPARRAAQLEILAAIAYE